jgi:DNA polymerase-3 subunit gamma/tau
VSNGWSILPLEPGTLEPFFIIMSYIVLARKWRPQGFDDLSGQEAVVKTLKNALSSGRIAHAYLFSGPRGVGKTSSARILAKALNCEQRADIDPCNKCQSCTAITEGASVDVFEIDGASNTSVDSVRELRDTVKYAPSGGKYKIYIIDEVHMLSTAAFNALLKTLEEPPPHVIFIFATTEPRKIPTTILSRCQHHSFRRMPKKVIKDRIKKITDTEKINIKDSALDMIAKAADGSMRDALTLLDQASSFSDSVNDNELQSLLGLPEPDIILNLSNTILSGNISETLSLIKELTDRGSDLRQLTRELVEFFRNIAIVKVTEDAEALLEFTPEEVQALRRHAANVTIEQLTLLLSELLKIEGEVRSAINPRYTLEMGLLRTSFVKGMTSIDRILHMVEEADVPSSVLNPASTPEPPEKKTDPGPPSATAADSVIVQNKEDMWLRLIERVAEDDHLLACKLGEAKVLNVDSEALSIGFNGGMSVLADSVKKSSSIIKPILKELSGHNLKLKIKSLPKSSIKRDINEIKKEVFSEPVVKDAMKRFNSSMVRVKALENNQSSNEHA